LHKYKQLFNLQNKILPYFRLYVNTTLCGLTARLWLVGFLGGLLEAKNCRADDNHVRYSSEMLPVIRGYSTITA
jgi:hypothetical protein